MEIKSKTPNKLAVTTSPTTSPKQPTPLEVKPVGSSTFKSGQHQIASWRMLPPAIAAKLTAISKQYGLPVDLGNFQLSDATPANIQSFKRITELMTGNSKLLPEMLKLAKQLLKADIKLSQFHASLTKEAIKHQQSIDKASADMFLAMVGYQQKSSKLEHRINARQKLIEARDAAYSEYYSNSVLGNELKVLDTEYKLMASNRQILADGRVKKLKADSDRKKRLQEYLDQANS
jgi:hypothetical protein